MSSKSFSISPAGLTAKQWDGVTDKNNDGQLNFQSDAVKTFEVTASNVVYYNTTTGSPSVTVDINGTTFH